jgi:hypothetical protein
MTREQNRVTYLHERRHIDSDELYDPDYEWGEALETDKTDLFNTLGITDESHEEAFGSGDSIMLKLVTPPLMMPWGTVTIT